MPPLPKPQQSTATMAKIIAAELVRRANAMNGMMAFTKFTFPRYQTNWHHKLIAQKLDDVLAGKTKRLMIFTPPRHGKTELVSRRFPAFAFGRHPDMKIVSASYSSDLARTINRDLQRIIDHEAYELLFPFTRLHGEAVRDTSKGMFLRNTDEFEIVNHKGYYKSVGVMSGLTGRGFNLGIIDDPVKDRLEASSQTYRDRCWEWYNAVFYTRRENDDAAIVLIQCMTGDTKVLFADGMERSLRDVRPGDKVATYRNGKLSEATVRNWASNGFDGVFSITMASGTVLKANARHPFLVCDKGELKWERTENLCRGQSMLRVKKENGKERRAFGKVAETPSSAGDTARRITRRFNGQTESGILPMERNRGVQSPSNIATASLRRIMTGCSLPKGGGVRYATNFQERTSEHIGEENSASTTIIRQEKFGHSSATTATLSSDTQKHPRLPWPLPSTSDFTAERIVDVSFTGIEEVFDVQVEDTENFIANGFVSHNTRWHEDDLAGRLLEADGVAGAEGANAKRAWEVVTLPAIKENVPTPYDPREPGQALWSKLFGLDALRAIEKQLGPYEWSALYQQSPNPRTGGMFDVTRFKLCDRVSGTIRSSVRYWDKAGTAGSGCYTCGALLHRTVEDQVIVADVVRGRWEATERERIIEQTAQLDGKHVRIWVEQEPGSGGKESAEATIRRLVGFVCQADRVTGDKATRAEPYAAQVGAGNVWVVNAPWTRTFLDEHGSFPGGKYMDQVDATAGAFNKLFAERWLHPSVGFGTDAQENISELDRKAREALMELPEEERKELEGLLV